MMNRNIAALQPGQPARQAYDRLVQILRTGYNLIVEQVCRNVMLSGPVTDIHPAEQYGELWERGVPWEETRIPARDYARTADRIIKEELGEPFAKAILVTGSSYYSLDHDPFGAIVVFRLNQAKLHLDRNFLDSRIVESLGTSADLIVVPADDVASPWNTDFQQVRSVFESEEGREAIPWLWLGINATVCYECLPAYDVFPALELPADTLREMGAGLSSDRSIVDFASIVQQALVVVRPELQKWQVAEEEAPRQRGRRRRGRKTSTDPQADQAIYDAWATGNYPKYSDLAREIGKSEREVRRAVDRHRHRQI
jgi:hypothetical protein